MKRDYGDGSLYQRKSDGRYVATLRADGKRLYFYGDTRAEALHKLKKAQREREQGQLATSGAKLSVRLHLEYWLGVHRSLIRDTTHVRNVALFERIDPFIGHVKLQKLTGDHLQHLYGQLQQEGMSPNSIRTIHIMLSTAFKDAVKWKRIAYNPCKDAAPPRMVKHQITFLTQEQAYTLMQAARGHPLECMITLAVTTGMRKGELLGLHWSDIDLEKGQLQVQRTATYLGVDGKRARYIETEPKTASSKRSISLPPFVVEGLRRHRTRQIQARLKAGENWQENNIVFTSLAGKHYNRSVLAEQYAQLLKAAGLAPMRFHDLRHSAATILLGLGVNIKVIQELLGHSNIQTTLNIYGHVIPGLQKEAMHTLDTLYQQAY